LKRRHRNENKPWQQERPLWQPGKQLHRKESPFCFGINETSDYRKKRSGNSDEGAPNRCKERSLQRAEQDVEEKAVRRVAKRKAERAERKEEILSLREEKQTHVAQLAELRRSLAKRPHPTSGHKKQSKRPTSARYALNDPWLWSVRHWSMCKECYNKLLRPQGAGASSA